MCLYNSATTQAAAGAQAVGGFSQAASVAASSASGRGFSFANLSNNQLAGLQAGVGAVGGIAQILANNSRQKKYFKAAEAARGAALRRDLEQLDRRQLQEQDVAAQQLLAVTRRARSAVGKAQAEAGASSTAGASVLAAIQAFERKGLEASQAVKSNLEATRASITAQRDALVTQRHLASINSQPNTNTTLDFFNLALALGAQALSTKIQLERG